MDIKFKKSVLLKDGPLKVKATHIKDMRNFIFLLVELFNCHEELCCSSEVVYCQFPKEQAEDELGFYGCELEN